MVVVVWIAEIGWQAAVDAARELRRGRRSCWCTSFPGDMEEVVHGAFAGLLGRHRSVPRGVDEAAEAGRAEQLLAAAAARLDRPATLDQPPRPGGTRDRRRGREGRPADPEPGRRPVPARTALTAAAHPVRRRSRAMRGTARLARLGARRRHHPAATRSPTREHPAGHPPDTRSARAPRRRLLEPAAGGVRDGKAFSSWKAERPGLAGSKTAGRAASPDTRFRPTPCHPADRQGPGRLSVRGAAADGSRRPGAAACGSDRW